MNRFSISIYLLVPFIFGLFSILTCLVSFQIVNYCLSRNQSPELLLTLATLVLASVSALIGYLIIWFVLKPVEDFIEKARLSAAVNSIDTDNLDSGTGDKGQGKAPNDRIEAFSRIFDRVAQALDVMDAESLFPEIIGKSRALRQVLAQILKVADTSSTVLLLGESGTGKERMAQSIVARSSRRDRPFIKINCAAITPTLMESELFGHERGAFTGAVARKKGCFEQAHTGTLFLDEIGDMPLELQVKLLRVIQERSFYRVGGSGDLVKVDVRIIAATNRNLDALVAEGAFREDLFYRINVFPVRLPPLREMKGDVSLLAQYFLEKIAPEKSFDGAALAILEGYGWPGNVRELQNVVERAVLVADNVAVVGDDHLPLGLKSSGELALCLGCKGQGEVGGEQGDEDDGSAGDHNGTAGLDGILRDIEQRLICEALRESSGVQVKAAAKLGINQRSLWNRVKKYGIDVGTFK